MFHWTTAGTLVIGLVLILYIRRRTLAGRTYRPFPPGPRGLPWFGNIIGINTDAPWVTYAEWGRTYGDVVYSRLLGKDIIIINSEKAARDLLDKRSINYSDRPGLIVDKIYGLQFISILLSYGDQWRLHRRLLHQTFRLDAVPRFLPLQHRKACNLLRQLLAAPARFDDHVVEYAGSIILNSTYGYDPSSRKDELLHLQETLSTIMLRAVRTDHAILVSAFPFLCNLPSWLPGGSWKKKIEIARACIKQYVERPFAYSLTSSGDGVPAMVYDGLKYMEMKGIPSEESWMNALMDATGTASLAGSESTSPIIRKFFLMMMLNLDVQEKAQEQIDLVVGTGRLPGICDRPLLPVVDAILRETMRYNPVAPILVPHAAVDDDVYAGFQIPKGSIVIANAWAMAHDECRYPNPHMFVPERFINHDGSLKPNDIEHIAYGFGRRICVGRHFADVSLWLAMVRVLAIFKILKPLDEHGTELSIQPKFSTGMLVHPLPFKCRIIPRFPGIDSKKLEELIGASTA